jgi:hypothetical protein
VLSFYTLEKVFRWLSNDPEIAKDFSLPPDYHLSKHLVVLKPGSDPRKLDGPPRLK